MPVVAVSDSETDSISLRMIFWYETKNMYLGSKPESKGRCKRGWCCPSHWRNHHRHPVTWSGQQLGSIGYHSPYHCLRQMHSQPNNEWHVTDKVNLAQLKTVGSLKAKTPWGHTQPWVFQSSRNTFQSYRTFQNLSNYFVFFLGLQFWSLVLMLHLQIPVIFFTSLKLHRYWNTLDNREMSRIFNFIN